LRGRLGVTGYAGGEISACWLVELMIFNNATVAELRHLAASASNHRAFRFVGTT